MAITCEILANVPYKSRKKQRGVQGHDNVGVRRSVETCGDLGLEGSSETL